MKNADKERKRAAKRAFLRNQHKKDLANRRLWDVKLNNGRMGRLTKIQLNKQGLTIKKVGFINMVVERDEILHNKTGNL